MEFPNPDQPPISPKNLKPAKTFEEIFGEKERESVQQPPDKASSVTDAVTPRQYNQNSGPGSDGLQSMNTDPVAAQIQHGNDKGPAAAPSYTYESPYSQQVQDIGTTFSTENLQRPDLYPAQTRYSYEPHEDYSRPRNDNHNPIYSSERAQPYAPSFAEAGHAASANPEGYHHDKNGWASDSDADDEAHVTPRSSKHATPHGSEHDPDDNSYSEDDSEDSSEEDKFHECMNSKHERSTTDESTPEGAGTGDGHGQGAVQEAEAEAQKYRNPITHSPDWDSKDNRNVERTTEGLWAGNDDCVDTQNRAKTLNQEPKDRHYSTDSSDDEDNQPFEATPGGSVTGEEDFQDALESPEGSVMGEEHNQGDLQEPEYPQNITHSSVWGKEYGRTDDRPPEGWEAEDGDDVGNGKDVKTFDQENSDWRTANMSDQDDEGVEYTPDGSATGDGHDQGDVQVQEYRREITNSTHWDGTDDGYIKAGNTKTLNQELEGRQYSIDSSDDEEEDALEATPDGSAAGDGQLDQGVVPVQVQEYHNGITDSPGWGEEHDGTEDGTPEASKVGDGDEVDAGKNGKSLSPELADRYTTETTADKDDEDQRTPGESVTEHEIFQSPVHDTQGWGNEDHRDHRDGGEEGNRGEERKDAPQRYAQWKNMQLPYGHKAPYAPTEPELDPYDQFGGPSGIVLGHDHPLDFMPMPNDDGTDEHGLQPEGQRGDLSASQAATEIEKLRAPFRDNCNVNPWVNYPRKETITYIHYEENNTENLRRPGVEPGKEQVIVVQPQANRWGGFRAQELRTENHCGVKGPGSIQTEQLGIVRGGNNKQLQKDRQPAPGSHDWLGTISYYGPFDPQSTTAPEKNPNYGTHNLQSTIEPEEDPTPAPLPISFDIDAVHRLISKFHQLSTRTDQTWQQSIKTWTYYEPHGPIPTYDETTSIEKLSQSLIGFAFIPKIDSLEQLHCLALLWWKIRTACASLGKEVWEPMETEMGDCIRRLETDAVAGEYGASKEEAVNRKLEELERMHEEEMEELEATLEREREDFRRRSLEQLKGLEKKCREEGYERVSSLSTEQVANGRTKKEKEKLRRELDTIRQQHEILESQELNSLIRSQQTKREALKRKHLLAYLNKQRKLQQFGDSEFRDTFWETRGKGLQLTDYPHENDTLAWLTINWVFNHHETLIETANTVIHNSTQIPTGDDRTKLVLEFTKSVFRPQPPKRKSLIKQAFNLITSPLGLSSKENDSEVVQFEIDTEKTQVELVENSPIILFIKQKHTDLFNALYNKIHGPARIKCSLSNNPNEITACEARQTQILQEVEDSYGPLTDPRREEAKARWSPRQFIRIFEKAERAIEVPEEHQMCCISAKLKTDFKSLVLRFPEHEEWLPVVGGVDDWSRPFFEKQTVSEEVTEGGILPDEKDPLLCAIAAEQGWAEELVYKGGEGASAVRESLDGGAVNGGSGERDMVVGEQRGAEERAEVEEDEESEYAWLFRDVDDQVGMNVYEAPKNILASTTVLSKHHTESGTQEVTEQKQELEGTRRSLIKKPSFKLKLGSNFGRARAGEFFAQEQE